MSIFEELRNDHDIQRKLVDLLIKTEGDSEDRARLFVDLKKQLEDHAAAEERYFYAYLMRHDATQDKTRHSVAEHKELEDIVEELDEIDNSSSAWLMKARVLRERLVHHLDEEEHEVFQQAGKVLTEGQKRSLAGDYRNDMDS